MKKPISLIFLLLLIIVACKKKEIQRQRCTCGSYIQYIDTTANEFLFVPTIFTPNGDGVNDTFFVYGQGIDSFTMDISRGLFSRDINNGWIGDIRSSFNYTDPRPNCELFDLVIDVKFISGVTKHYESTVIRFLNDGTSCPENFSQCVFGNQFDGSRLNTNLPSGEAIGC